MLTAPQGAGGREGCDFTAPVTTLLRDRRGRRESTERQTMAGRHRGEVRGGTREWGAGGVGTDKPKGLLSHCASSSRREKKQKNIKRENTRERFSVERVFN